MIRSFKLYADANGVWGVFLEYGRDETATAIGQVEQALKVAGVIEPDMPAIEQALNGGTYAVVEISKLPPENMRGECWMTVDSERKVMANVIPPLGRGKAASHTDIADEIKKAGYGDFYRLDEVISKNLQEVIKSAKPAVFRAAEARDAEVKVEISKDRKAAFINYTRPRGGAMISFEEVIRKLNEAKVTTGIDENRMREILEGNRDLSQARIATAKEPVDGQDASIKFLFDAYGTHIGPRISEKDLADYRDLGLFQSVDQDAPLAAKTPATAGEDGIDVTGAPIKAKKGRDLQLPKGKNTKISEKDENMLVAAVPGSPKLVAGRVTVDEIIIVGDVDFSTGNIDFNGSVMVNGIVNNGFSVSAGGDLTCSDVVEGANLTAGGSILVKRGIKGLGKSVVKAGRDVVAKFIERCNVSAGGSVVVEEALIHSTAAAGDRIEVTGAKGSIFGGQAIAGNLIRANYIGSEMAIKTVLEVGAAPHLRDRLNTLTAELIKKNSDFGKAEKNLQMLSSLRNKEPLPEHREELYQTLMTLTGQLQSEISEISGAVASLEDELQRTQEGRVEAGKVIYPGVKIIIKNAARRIQEPMHKAIFMKEGGEIVLAIDVAETSGE